MTTTRRLSAILATEVGVSSQLRLRRCAGRTIS
jgi:hypothetical protein